MSIKLKDMVFGLTPLDNTSKVDEGGNLDINQAFYQIGNGIENLEWVGKRHASYVDDKKIQQHAKKLMKAHNDLKKHLEKTYGERL